MAAIVWQMVIGLGVFLYGMSRLERGIRALSDVRLKHWLANSTGTPVASAGAGMLVTAILQSSSMVSLLVLAFASAGLIPLYNAVGVILGANLGTTITGWLVATIGFKLSLSALALPLFGLGGLSQVLLSDERRLWGWGGIALGLGVLLFGLSLMKESVEGLPARWDISLLQGYHPVVYLLVGTVVTALIQSSSAAVMIVLTALHGGLITLPEAAALVIGADLGTTSTVLLGSMTGAAIKRQLALAHVLFNLVTGILAFFLLLPLLPRAVQWLGIDYPLYTLVGFHSLKNLAGLLIFLPVLMRFSLWLAKRFAPEQNNLPVLANVPAEVPEAALPALASSLRQLWLIAATNNLKMFNLNPGALHLPISLQRSLAAAEGLDISDQSTQQVYELTKQREVEVLQLSFRLQQQPLDETQARQLSRMVEMTRSLVYASKSLRDIAADLRELTGAIRQSTTGAVGWIYSEQQLFQSKLYEQLLPMMLERHNEAWCREQLDKLASTNDHHYEDMNDGVYERGRTLEGELMSLSTLLNVNREIHHSVRSLLLSVSLWQNLWELMGEEHTAKPEPDLKGKKERKEVQA